MPRRFRPVLLTCGMLTAGQVASGSSDELQPEELADNATLEQTITQQDSARSFEIQLDVSPDFAFQADIDDSAGDVAVTRTNASGTLTVRPADRLQLRFQLIGNFAHFDFDDAEDLVPGASSLFDEVYEAGTTISAAYELDSNWSLVGIGIVRMGWESGADLGDAISGGGFVGVGYQFSERFRLTLGGGVTTQLERNPLFIPYFGFYWQIDDFTTLRSEGLGASLTRRISDDFDISLKGSFQGAQYRLADSDGPLDEGIVRDRRVPIGVELAWRPAEGLTLALEGGAVVYQQFVFRNSEGSRIEDYETDPTPYVGFRLSYRF